MATELEEKPLTFMEAKSIKNTTQGELCSPCS